VIDEGRRHENSAVGAYMLSRLERFLSNVCIYLGLTVNEFGSDIQRAYYFSKYLSPALTRLPISDWCSIWPRAGNISGELPLVSTTG